MRLCSEGSDEWVGVGGAGVNQITWSLGQAVTLPQDVSWSNLSQIRATCRELRIYQPRLIKKHRVGLSSPWVIFTVNKDDLRLTGVQCVRKVSLKLTIKDTSWLFCIKNAFL